jgi:hypothetical protein
VTFNWVGFFEQRGIEYVTAGPNVGRGEVGIQCPFCGSADRSQHMSVNLEGRGWVCRRNRSEHRGRGAPGLIRALLGCSYAEARAIAGEAPLPSAGGALAEIEMLMAPALEAKPARVVELCELSEFRPFAGKPSALPFARYMSGRGFGLKFLRRASERMGLRYCTRGPFAGRVVFLVHMRGKLVNWTGRTTSPRARLRYKALSADPEVASRDGLPPALLSIEQCLLWYDDLLEGGDLLEVVEGPMDALKLRLLGRRATCLFTNTPSSHQVNLLREVAPLFRRRVLLLDRGAEANALRAAQDMSSLGFSASWLPAGVDDPGELTRALLDKIEY